MNENFTDRWSHGGAQSTGLEQTQFLEPVIPQKGLDKINYIDYANLGDRYKMSL